MIEYIERDKAKEEILSWAVVINRPQNLSIEDTLCVPDSIEDTLPTAYQNDFCSYGKRKEGAEDG